MLLRVLAFLENAPKHTWNSLTFEKWAAFLSNCCTLRILGPSFEGVEPSITRVCNLTKPL